MLDHRARRSRPGRDGARDPLKTEEPVSVLLHCGCAIALGLVVWASIRSHRTRPSLDAGLSKARRLAAGGVLLAVAAFAGLALGGSVPFVQARERMVWRDTFKPPFDPSVYPSPLGYYRQYVKELATEPLFDITGLPDGVPIRMATLDTYDGIVWKVTLEVHGRCEGRPATSRGVGTEVDPNFGPCRHDRDRVVPGELRVRRSLASDGRRGRVGVVQRIRRPITRTCRCLSVQPHDRHRSWCTVTPDQATRYDVTVAIPPSLSDLSDDAQFAENNLEPIEGIPGPATGLGSGLVEEVDGLERVQILADYLSEGYYSDSSSGQSPVFALGTAPDASYSSPTPPNSSATPNSTPQRSA